MIVDLIVIVLTFHEVWKSKVGKLKVIGEFSGIGFNIIAFELTILTVEVFCY